MFAQERQAEIAELVSASRRVSGADLSRRFDVAMETVRRDLAALEAAGRLRRVHGGAVSLDRPASVEAAIAGREAPKSPAKRRIAAAAVRLLEAEGAVTVVLDAGTTVEAVADELANWRSDDSEQPLQVLTHALHVAGRLADHPDIELDMVGGAVRKLTWAAAGARTAGHYSDHRVDLAILGCSGVSEGFGFSTPHAPEAAVKAAIAGAARRVVVVCDAEKHGHETFSRYAHLSEIDVMITDAEPPSGLARALERAGVEIVIA